MSVPTHIAETHIAETHIAQPVTEDFVVYMGYVYELAIAAGFEMMEAQNLSEIALYKKIYQGIKYSEKHEKILRGLLMRKHH